MCLHFHSVRQTEKESMAFEIRDQKGPKRVAGKESRQKFFLKMEEKV